MERSIVASDPILAEVRKDRERLFARFNYDIKAFCDYLAAQAGPRTKTRPRGSRRRIRSKAR